MKFAEWLKMWTALVGLLASAGLGVSGIPMSWKLPLALVVAASSAFAVWKVPNADPPSTALPWKSAGPAWDADPDPDWAVLPVGWDQEDWDAYEDDYMD